VLSVVLYGTYRTSNVTESTKDLGKYLRGSINLRMIAFHNLILNQECHCHAGMSPDACTAAAASGGDEAGSTHVFVNATVWHAKPPTSPRMAVAVAD
jgi:hypothetical protein